MKYGIEFRDSAGEYKYQRLLQIKLIFMCGKAPKKDIFKIFMIVKRA